TRLHAFRGHARPIGPTGPSRGSWAVRPVIGTYDPCPRGGGTRNVVTGGRTAVARAAAPPCAVAPRARSEDVRRGATRSRSPTTQGTGGRDGPTSEVRAGQALLETPGAGPGLADAGARHDRLRPELLGLGAAQPARPAVQGRPRSVLVRAVAPCGRAGRGRLAGPDPGGGTDRPVRRTGD